LDLKSKSKLILFFNFILVNGEEKKKEIKKTQTEEEVERIFESTWNNWTSRRRCEQEHIPEYIKRQKRKDSFHF